MLFGGTTTSHAVFGGANNGLVVLQAVMMNTMAESVVAKSYWKLAKRITGNRAAHRI
jgi:hypothetical protein